MPDLLKMSKFGSSWFNPCWQNTSRNGSSFSCLTMGNHFSPPNTRLSKERGPTETWTGKSHVNGSRTYPTQEHLGNATAFSAQGMVLFQLRLSR